jgi:hypothetical protein
MQDFPTTIFELARNVKTDKKGLPNLLQLAVMYRKYGSLIFLAKPPIVVQKVLFSAIAWIGCLLGYSAEYSYPLKLMETEKRIVGTRIASDTIDQGG